MLGIRNDIELNKLLGKNADFAESGVVPNIQKQILPGKKGKSMNDDEEMNEWAISPSLGQLPLWQLSLSLYYYAIFL